MSTQFIFSHYETCYDSHGGSWLKAWYVHEVTGERRWLPAE